MELKAQAGNPGETYLRLIWQFGSEFGEMLGLEEGTMDDHFHIAETERPKSILAVGEAVTYMAKHGRHTPDDLGAWLMEANDRLWYEDEPEAPIAAIWRDLTRVNPSRQAMARVTALAHEQMRIYPSPEADSDRQALINK